jgi:integrase
MLKLKKREKSSYWQIEGTTIGGKRIRQSTGCKGKKEAEIVLKRIENLYYDKLAGEKKHWPTLQESLEDYIDVKDLHINIITQLRKITDDFGHTFIDTIKPTFSDHIKFCLTPGIKNSSVNKIINLVQAMINLQMIKLNVQPIKLNKFSVDETKITWHNEKEFEILLRHSGKVRKLISFLYYTGCRISEAVNLDWTDIDYEENLISVFMSKTKKYKYIYINPKLKKELGLHQGKGKVFTYNTRHGIKSSWRRMEKLSGIKSNPHKFRHTFATRVLKNSDIKTLMSLGGWSSEKMALRYAKVVDTRKASVIKNL